MSRRQRRTREKQARHARRPAATGGLALAATILSGSVAEAATLQVESSADTTGPSTCNTGDGCTLRDALTNAGASDTIVFNSSLSGATILLGSALPTFGAGDLTIDGSGAPGLTVDGQGGSGIFAFSNTYGTSVAISDFHLTGGYKSSGRGGAVNSYGDSYGDGALQLSSMTIDDSQTDGSGGAVYAAGPLTITDSTLSGNSTVVGAYEAGGAVSADDQLTISNSSLFNNSADYGGAIYASGDGAVMIDNTTLYGNQAYSDFENPVGGAIYINSASYPVTITDSTIHGNSANTPNEDAVGGAIAIDDANADVTITGSAIYGNTADSDGGGANGGAISIAVVNAAVTIANSTIYNNTITANDAAYGGAMYVENVNTPYSVTITGSTILGNSTYSLYNAAHGGGVMLEGGSAAPQILNTVVFGNTASANVGNGGSAAGPDLYSSYGTSFATSFSLIGDRSGATAPPSASDLPDGTNPQFNGFGANGTETLNPAPTSPLVDAGNSFGLTTDQRGMTRPFDGSAANAAGGDGADIGAVELQAAELVAGPSSSAGGIGLPIVTSISPTSGGPGTSVSIVGGSFAGVSSVRFGAIPATYVVDGYEHITANAPAGVTGTVDVIVSNTAGSSQTSAADRFTFVGGGAGPGAGGPAQGDFGPLVEPKAFVSGNILPVSGTILVKLPGTTRFIRLTRLSTIPVGSIIDARKGTVRIIAATDTLGHTGEGEFTGGIFSFTQRFEPRSKTSVLTDLRLKGGNFAVCRVRVTGDAARRRVVRYLMAKASGKFNTVGRYASGVERGTTWRIVDTCTTTEVRVQVGQVSAFDRLLRKRVLLKAGGVYVSASAAERLQERLGLSDDELLAVLGVDALTLLSGDDLPHRPELPLLLALTEPHDPALLRRWLRTAGPRGRPLALLLARDFAAFEDALADLEQRGFVIGG